MLTNPAYQVVVVNPVTTLVSLVLDERPGLELNGAEAIVRRFLGLPANYSLGLALRQSSGYASPFFSPVAFMTAAQAAGGLDVFEHQLLHELLANSAPQSFPFLGDPLNPYAQSLVTGALSYAGGQAAGWVMAQTGLVTPGVTEADIMSLQKEIEDQPRSDGTRTHD